MFEMVLSARIGLNKVWAGDLYKKNEANHLVSLKLIKYPGNYQLKFCRNVGQRVTSFLITYPPVVSF